MGIFRKKEERAETINAGSTNNNLGLEAMLGIIEMTKENALQIPSVTAAIDKLASTVARLPVKLYQNQDGKIIEVTDDRRAFLMNVDTGDTLTTVDFWKAIIEDYYLGKGAYIYKNKEKGEIKSLNYVDERKVSVQANQKAIFKDFDILVDGQKYYPFDFIKILRKTKDGCTSSSIVSENSKILSVAYDSLKFEDGLVKKGGNKKGFFKSSKRLTDEAIKDLKESIASIYSSADRERFPVLNDGIDFKETSATSVEMQLNENKLTNADEIFKIFGFSSKIITGGATQSDKDTFNEAVTNLLNTIEAALDKDLLLEKEKESFYFAFDTKELTRGNIKERFEAYGIALDKHFMQTDEVRKREDLEPIGFNFVKLGLGDVLYDPQTKQVFVPNTGTQSKLYDLKGGE
jgi:HK97 family phage portal protein